MCSLMDVGKQGCCYRSNITSYNIQWNVLAHLTAKWRCSVRQSFNVIRLAALGTIMSASHFSVWTKVVDRSTSQYWRGRVERGCLAIRGSAVPPSALLVHVDVSLGKTLNPKWLLRLWLLCANARSLNAPWFVRQTAKAAGTARNEKYQFRSKEEEEEEDEIVKLFGDREKTETWNIDFTKWVLGICLC